MPLEYIDKTNNVTDAEILTDMKKVSEILQTPFLTIKAYTENGRYNPTTVIRHFKTWNGALQLAGLKISNEQYSTQELFNNLADIWFEIGHQPSRRELALFKSPISYKAYERRFGKWSLALRAFVEYYNATNDINLEQCVERYAENPIAKAHKTKREPNKRMRWAVLMRDHRRCCICGASRDKDPNLELHVDHIIPWAKGGETTMDNLQTLCADCNWGKSDQLFTEGLNPLDTKGNETI